ncbi:PTS sugar transporter subunit IIB [Clostridium sp. YIM B02505]|uniref:PTS sugar transporter subunit IIB n=1 Tax=Clostridium yunnanense TaxID=2800325 RepID=A0ABS1EPH5_9CLOT|nr:PTS sugar transporter subunit IIB [Clostridium yunnanense]MBK1811275.1 PTS sugar transporter subunit IIB [Clostridium yunnanense]
MKKILLVCSAGMSTSLLVEKMQEAAIKKGVECSIEATGESDVKNYINDADVVLLGPQVRFLLSQLKENLAGSNIPVEIIKTVDYGTMNGEKVLQRALELIENK